MTIERETMTREEMEKQTLADLGWTFEGLALLRECDTEDDVRMEMSIGPVRRAFDDLVDARLKIQELEAELTTWRADVKGYASDSIARQKKYDAVCIELSRLKEEREKELLEFGAFSMNHKPAEPFNVDECLVAFLSSRKQTDKEKG